MNKTRLQLENPLSQKSTLIWRIAQTLVWLVGLAILFNLIFFPVGINGLLGKKGTNWGATQEIPFINASFPPSNSFIHYLLSKSNCKLNVLALVAAWYFEKA